MMRKLFLLLFLIPVLAVAQQKQITLEDIYKKGTFRGEFVPGFAGEDIDSLVKASDVKDEAGKPIPLGDHLVSTGFHWP
jgi:dipeptidyl-peptidase-4